VEYKLKETVCSSSYSNALNVVFSFENKTGQTTTTINMSSYCWE